MVTVSYKCRFKECQKPLSSKNQRSGYDSPKRRGFCGDSCEYQHHIDENHHQFECGTVKLKLRSDSPRTDPLPPELPQHDHECPKCGAAPMVLKYSPKKSSYFYGCIMFPKCHGGRDVTGKDPSESYSAKQAEQIQERRERFVRQTSFTHQVVEPDEEDISIYNAAFFDEDIPS